MKTTPFIMLAINSSSSRIVLFQESAGALNAFSWIRRAHPLFFSSCLGMHDQNVFRAECVIKSLLLFKHFSWPVDSSRIIAFFCFRIFQFSWVVPHVSQIRSQDSIVFSFVFLKGFLNNTWPALAWMAPRLCI